MAHKIVTVSREFGSGGRTVGKHVAEKLGIPCYDNELLEKIAEESGLAKEYIAERGEYTPKGGWLATAFADRSVNGPQGGNSPPLLQPPLFSAIMILRQAGMVELADTLDLGSCEQS